MRKEIESSVIAVNKHLKDEVTKMSALELLRNCHPIYRKDYARALRRSGQITENQLLEFTK